MNKAIIFVLAALIAPPALSQTATALLSKCFADNTTGKDRKNMARWVFSAITVHPEIKDLANTTSDLTDQTSRTMGAIVTRLLTETCVSEATAVVRKDGPQGIGKGFETLGQLAMMELMSNTDVLAAVSKFERYVDQEKMRPLFEAK